MRRATYLLDVPDLDDTWTTSFGYAFRCVDPRRLQAVSASFSRSCQERRKNSPTDLLRVVRFVPIFQRRIRGDKRMRRSQRRGDVVNSG